MTLNRKPIVYALLLFTTLIFNTRLYAQSNLMKEVTIGDIKQQRIGKVLDKIASKGNFYFAYNNKTIPADSVVSVAGYRGTLFSLLDKLLGDSYEFKEVPGYIVLRHAPGKLYLTAEVDKDQGRQTMVKGFVKDASSQKGIIRASVYEKNLLISTLTDDKGYFELTLKTGSSSLLLTVSKENYRDTSLYVLPVVNVDSKHTNTYYKYYPDDYGGNGVEHSRFARFFISSKQLIQGINLGNFFTSAPYQVSLTPGLSSHGMYNSQIIDHLSLNMLGGYTAGVKGIELAGLFNINRKDVSFFQAAGLFNIVGGSMRGFQATAVYNNVLNNAYGMQAAGIINRTQNFTGGMQIAGALNIDQQASGFFIAGLVNRAKSLNSGVQIAGLFNTAGQSKGFQLASVCNWSAGETGSQFAGVFNVAKKVKGFQFAGLVNIADSSDYPIGLINFIKNGEKSLALSTDETLFTHLDFRSGGRVLYGLIGAGYKSVNQESNYTLDLGFGIHLINNSKFSLNGEYVTQLVTDTKKMFYQTNSFKVFPGYKLTQHLRLFAGPALNITSADVGDNTTINGWVLTRHVSSNAKLTAVNVGITGGLQLVW